MAERFLQPILEDYSKKGMFFELESLLNAISNVEGVVLSGRVSEKLLGAFVRYKK